MQQVIKLREILEKEAAHKKIALEILDLFRQEKFKEGTGFFSPQCKTHNPYFAGSIDQLTDAMIQANKEGKTKYPNAEFTVEHALADGEFVAVQTNLLNDKNEPKQGGLRQMHLFRFDGDKIVEYWDITQQVPAGLPNSAGAF